MFIIYMRKYITFTNQRKYFLYRNRENLLFIIYLVLFNLIQFSYMNSCVKRLFFATEKRTAVSNKNRIFGVMGSSCIFTVSLAGHIVYC